MGLKKGTEVEVTSDDDGFRGVWYLAKIKQPPKKSDEGFVVVEYNELVSEEDETKKLSEKVHVSFVRPLAPSGTNDDVVEVNHVVDVFHKDGWWVGVVQKLVAKDEFVVAFDDPPDSMTVKRADVRLHFDWVNGKWVKPEKKINNMDSSGLAMPSDHPGNSERQNGSAQKQQPGKSCASTEKKGTDMNDDIVEKVCDAEEVDMFVKEIKGASAKKCETPPGKHQKSKILDQELQTFDDFRGPAMLSGYSRRQNSRAKKQQAGKSGASTEKKTTGIHDEVVEKEGDAEKVDISVKEVKGVSAKNCKTLLKKVQQNKSMYQEMHTIDDSGRPAMLSNQSGSSTRRSKRVKTQQAEKGSVSTKKKGNTGVRVHLVEKEYVGESIKGAPSAKDCETSQKKQSTDQEITTVDSANGSTQGDVSSKRKRGKQIGNRSIGDKRFLRKMNMEDSWVGNKAEINAKSDRLIQTPVDIKSSENHVQPSSNDSLKVTADKKQTSVVRLPEDQAGETDIVPLSEDQAGETVPSKRVRRFKNSLSNEREEFHNASLGNASLPEIHHEKNVDMLMDGNPGDVNDDQVSNSILQVDKPSPTGSDSSRTLHVQHQCANANGRQDNFGTPVAKKDRVDNIDGPKLSSAPGDLPVQIFNQADKNGELGTPASVSIDNVENNQSLPFIKRSPLWKAIESMEIYKRTAQKPHFSPLVKLNEETREGLAIAHMVNFSNLAEKITKIQFSDPITVIERNMETLAELESNGFDVERIRAILTQLLSMKQNGEELHKEYQDFETKISHSLNEIKRVDEEIIQLNKNMDELVAKLGEVVSTKEMKDSVHSRLKSEQDGVSQRVQSLQLDFKNIAGSLCQGGYLQ